MTAIIFICVISLAVSTCALAYTTYRMSCRILDAVSPSDTKRETISTNHIEYPPQAHFVDDYYVDVIAGMEGDER